MSGAEAMASALNTAAKWFAHEVIANKMLFPTPLPAALRPWIAEWMVNDPVLGWPDREAAQDYLAEWEWA